MTETQDAKCPTKVLLISLFLLVIGVVGWLMLRGHWVFYPLAHVGALGVLGILAALAGLIAAKKGYDFRRAFLVSLFIPIALGVIAVLGVKYLGGEGAQFFCGGSVCLAASVILIIVSSLVRSQSPLVPK